MSGLILYNGLHEIINTIKHLNSQENKDIVWFGNAREIPLINHVILKSNKKITKIIDNDEGKWGKPISEIYDISFYINVVSVEAYKGITISSPESLKGNTNTFVIIASKYYKIMKEQLLSLGIPENNIVIFSTGVKEGIMAELDKENALASYTPLTLREMQLLELDILKDFSNYCKKNNLKYFLSSGTLLGAIRHKGFIPWDDDIDVYMPYEDYLTFMKNYPNTGRYKTIDWNKDENYFLPFGKLLDTETKLLHAGYPIQGVMNVYIDIFPLAGYSDKIKPEEYWKRNEHLETKWNEYYIARDFIPNIPDIRQQIIEERYAYSFYKSKLVGGRHIIPHIKQWAVRKEIYQETIPVEFEGMFFDAPAGYDEFLTIRYKNYMQLPKEEDRVSHSFYSYRKNGGN